MQQQNAEIKNWKLIERKEVFSFHPWGCVNLDKVQLPSGRIIDDYYHLRLPSYVMICAQQANGEWLFVKEYKHGIASVTYLFPAGFVEQGESSLQAAKRELKEETGFEAAVWHQLGSYYTDGARGGGQAHFFYAKELTRVSVPKTDEQEVSQLYSLNNSQVIAAIKSGEISLLSAVGADALITNPELLEALIKQHG